MERMAVRISSAPGRLTERMLMMVLMLLWGWAGPKGWVADIEGVRSEYDRGV